MGVLEIGQKSLLVNQIALQTTGNNIANVNTEGYSRQRVKLSAIEGQFSGGGYIGKGVEVSTISRSYSEFLTRQAALTASTSAGDIARADKLKQLEGIFEGGSSGLGAAINEMLNSFADVAAAPTDLTARTVVLTRIDETAARFRSTSQRLDDLQLAATQEISQKVSAANSLAKSIASINGEIVRAQALGQPPNDLLDRRDQLVRDLNQFVQTSSVMADDGSMSIFVANSEALVLGSTATSLAVMRNDFGDPFKSQLTILRGDASTALSEDTMGGGELAGLLRFQNTDLQEGRNLLGRLTLAVSTSMNDQHKLGLDLDGNRGGNLFTQATLSSANVFVPAQAQPPSPRTRLNAGNATLDVSIADVSKFSASDYEVNFSSATQGAVVRKSDGVVTNFDFAATNPIVIDGINISVPSGTAANGDRFLIKPYSTSAANITREFALPRALAVASPVITRMGSANTGSLQLTSIKVNGQPNGLVLPPSPTPPATNGGGVTLTFTSGPPSGYRVSGSMNAPQSYLSNPSNPPYDPGVSVVTYTPNQVISIDGWQLTLTGAAKDGDVITVGNSKDAQYGNYYTRNAGNAAAMMDLRDVAMFDGAALTDGYAGLMSQIGIRAQSANYSATVSTSIAGNVEKDRTSVAGVNLDEEAAKLIQYQQAYQASAKMIQIAQSIFNDLISSLRS